MPPGAAGGRAMMTNPAADAPGTKGAANVHIVSLAHDQCAQTSDLNPAVGRSNKDQRIGATPGSDRKRVRVIPRWSPLLCTANSRNSSEHSKPDKCSSVEVTSKRPDAPCACENGSNSTGGYRICRVRDRGDCDEEGPEHHALEHGRCFGADELGQKRCEEDGSLWIEQSNDNTIAKDPPNPRGLDRWRLAVELGGANGLNAEVNKIQRARVFHDRERDRGDRKQCRQPDRCADSIPEIAEGNACYRGEAMAPALRNAPSHYVEDTGPGRHREDEARDQER